jgi:transcriptional regulator with XRE-family HTH domain/tetratricopeptide (TPR) repeat protein
MDRKMMKGSDGEGLDPTCGQLLRRYRSLAGLTQEELAERCGYSANYIGKLERDERRPPPAAIECLASTLELREEERALLAAARERRTAPDIPAHQLVGRDAESAEIRRHLSGLGPPVLLLAGEPGIGKTRLLDEAAASAGQTAWRVVRGGCQRRAADLYAPVSGAVADALASLPLVDRDEVIRQAGQLNLLLPELAQTESRPGADGRNSIWSDGTIEPEQRRRLLFTAVERCLRAVAGPAGVVLVLDDLQWAGPDAFDLLRAVIPRAGSPRVRLIGAYRDSERAADARLQEFVADMARDSLVQVLALQPLPDAEAERLVKERIPPETAPLAVVPAIVRRAGGVPFFLISYSDNLHPGEGSEPELTLPWTVAQVIRQRVLALPETAQELLGVAAAAGRVVSHSLLVRVTHRSDEEVLQALETAVDARLLTEDTRSGYQFAHDLIRETIEGGLSVGRRRLLHRRIGEALEGDPRASPESLAFHFTLGDDDEKAIAYLELAGDQAQQRVAHTAAAIFFQQAIDRLAQADRRQDAVHLYEKLGVALYRAARNDGAILALERARTGYLAAGDEDGAARVTVRLADAHYRRGTTDDDLAKVLSLSESGPVPAPETASESNLLRLEAVARLLFATPSPQRMLTVGRSLTRAGNTTGSQKLQMMGKRLQGGGLLQLGRVADGTALLEETIPPDPLSKNDERAVEIGGLVSAGYLSMGDLGRSQALSQRMLAVAESLGDEVAAAMHTVILAGDLYVAGDWPGGDDLLRRALERSMAAGPSYLMVRTTQIVAKCFIWGGKWDQARSYLESSLQTSQSMRIDGIERSALAELADLDLLEGRPESALNRLQPILEEEHTWEYLVPLFSTLAAVYLKLDDPERARTYAQRAVAEARRTNCWVNGIRALEISGTAEARGGNCEAARAGYGEGLERARRIPFPYAEARLLCAYSLLDEQTNDPASAETKLAAGLAIFERLGATRDAGRIRLNATKAGNQLRNRP